MMGKEVFALFDYGCAKNNDRKRTLADQPSYFDLYVFTNEDIDLIKELDIFNALLTDYDFKKEGFVEFLSGLIIAAMKLRLFSGVKKIIKKYLRLMSLLSFFDDAILVVA